MKIQTYKLPWMRYLIPTVVMHNSKDRKLSVYLSGSGTYLFRMAGKIRKSKVEARPDVFLKLLQQRFPGKEIVKEHRFHPVRMWRFDYAIPALKIAVEVDGAVWTGGRHNRAAGYIADMEKLNTAASMGWLVLRFTTDDRFYMTTFNLIETTIKERENENNRDV